MTDETNVLDQLVGQIPDHALRTRLTREIELLRGSRRFGLVFDRHLPESVRLAGHPIRKGVMVALRDESRSAAWRVLRFTDTSHSVAVLDGDGGERPVADLIVVRESGEPVFPGLRTSERIANGRSDAPWHTVINGENLHALQALRSTHRGKVDLIYIDPPYNTGNEGWIYNDRYIDANDRAKSSKWLSFLERRLLIAKDLLKPTGVIIAAIGDEEQHRLRMVMDQVFKPENFLANITWQGLTKSDARYSGGGADYMLIYARHEEALTESGTRWRVKKDGVDDALATAARLFADAGEDPERATKKYREWLTKNLARLGRGVEGYRTIDDQGRLFQGDNMASPTPRPNLHYDVSHPVTRKPVKAPKNGWQFGPALMQQRIDAGLILFGPDETTIPTRKRLLTDAMMIEVQPVFYADRRRASKHVANVLGDTRFPYPKDHEVLMRWIKMIAPDDGVVLDFFGGSGTTSEAVMRLNADDGGTRQSILVTNNEVGARTAKALRKAGHHPGDQEWESKGVFEYVCRPRISTVVTGTRPDGSSFGDGLAANVEMFDLTYLDPGVVRRGREFEAIAPLLWLEAGATGERIETEPEAGWALTDTYGVLFSVDALNHFAVAVEDAVISARAPRIIFIVTDSPAEYQSAGDRLPAGVPTVRLYQDYLANYTINVEDGTR